MKLQRYFLALFFIALAAKAFPQVNDSIKPITKINKSFLVVAHIVLDKDSVADIDAATIQTMLLDVNKLFQPINVTFTLCKVNIIYNFQFDQMYDSRIQDLFVSYGNPNRINMYFVHKLADKPKVCGKATLSGVTSPNQPGVLIMKDNCFTVETVAHELGHYFGLEHTFENSHGPELADGSNCKTTGDGICDTPADPYVDGDDPNMYVNYSPSGSCIFISEKQDANGNYYNPDVCNIMSYYHCGTKFSRDQYEKMAQTYLQDPIEW